MATNKRRRLQDLIGLGGVSDNALAAILENLRQEPIEESVSRKDCNRAARDSLRGMLLQTQLPCKTGGTFTWSYLDPQRLLRKCIDQSPQLAEAYGEALRNHPCGPEAPWSMILYFDELTPGNVLRPDNHRKMMAVYMSFRELGIDRLCKTEYWFTLAVVRVDMIRKVDGQWSHMFRVLLRTLFLGDNSFESAGVLLYAGGPHLLFARLSITIADEGALKQGIDCKGSSGLRPCAACKNVLMRGSDIANRDASGYLVEVTCSNFNRFDFASDKDMFDVVDMLNARKGHLRAGAFKQLQMSSGFNFNPLGVLADVELRPHSRPAASWTYDPMHCIYSNGIAAVQIHLFLESMKTKTHLQWRDLENFCKAEWQFPVSFRAKGRAIYEVFNPARERASKESFKCGATELLVAFPLVLHFAELFVARYLVDEMNCLRALAAVIHETQEAKFGRGDGGDRLARAISYHFELFKRTYGEEHVKPKHHYVCHLPRQLARDGLLLDAFTLERKHQEVKQAASNTDNTAEFEKSVLSRVHVEELRSLKALQPNSGLRGKQERYEPLAATVADGVEYKGLRLHAGDIVFRSGVALLVRGAIMYDEGEIAVLVQPLELVRRDSQQCSTWKQLPSLARCGGDGLCLAACWSIQGDHFTVLSG